MGIAAGEEDAEKEADKAGDLYHWDVVFIVEFAVWNSLLVNIDGTLASDFSRHPDL